MHHLERLAVCQYDFDRCIFPTVSSKALVRLIDSVSLPLRELALDGVDHCGIRSLREAKAALSSLEVLKLRKCEIDNLINVAGEIMMIAGQPLNVLDFSFSKLPEHSWKSLLEGLVAATGLQYLYMRRTNCPFAAMKSFLMTSSRLTKLVQVDLTDTAITDEQALFFAMHYELELGRRLGRDTDAQSRRDS